MSQTSHSSKQTFCNFWLQNVFFLKKILPSYHASCKNTKREVTFTFKKKPWLNKIYWYTFATKKISNDIHHIHYLSFSLYFSPIWAAVPFIYCHPRTHLNSIYHENEYVSAIYMQSWCNKPLEVKAPQPNVACRRTYTNHVDLWDFSSYFVGFSLVDSRKMMSFYVCV